ncbi:putative General secretion pathway protein D [Nitrospira sp. KM1]|uniref:secretin N-terminal domain-containing protein n=1 Tax=Nitrospira sp. KM1 TaxID=1936990 RepID=UPI0013A7712B|nr:secretin N-terminal domain-containing protein [Nitrospira sp. KM1]BCA54077.1 putative General secretion pathway protein D [Nitrospira sp. KM1]
MGDQHLAAGKWEEAVLAYRQALKDDPFNPSLQDKYAMARERAAAQYEDRGRALLKERQIEPAAEQFKKALSMEPTNPEHQSGFAEAMRLKESRLQYREAERLVQLGRTDEAMEAFSKAAELDPSYSEALEGISQLTAEQQASDREDRRKQPVTLRFRNAGLKDVLEGIGKAGGTNLIFDKDVRNDPVTITIEDTPFEDALNLILNSNSLFARTVAPGLLIISPNTKQKQEQYQDLMVRTFYLSNAKAKDMAVLLKGMLDSKRVHANEQLNTIVIRDQPEKVEMAEKIILANDRLDSEVLFDVEVLEVDRTVDQTYGLTYPKQVAGAIVPPGFTGAIAGDLAQQFTLQQLTSLGKGNYLLKLPTNVQLDFFKQVTDAKTLAAPKVRVVNNKKAEINIGDKQPILLSTTNVLPGQAATGAVPTTSTVTSIEFRDTGVKLTVEPLIHLNNEMSLKMKIEVVRLGEQVLLQANPPITQFKFGNRSAETMLNVKDGETIVLGGLLQEEDRRTKVTIPWIGSLPVIGNLLSSFKTQRVTTEVILTLTPHIVQTMTPPGMSKQAFWSGTESTYATGPLFTPQGKSGSGVKALSDISQAGKISKASRAAKPPLASLTRMTSAGPYVSIKPDQTVVAVGREFKLALHDERLRSSPEGLFRLQYDPKVMALKSLVHGEIVPSDEARQQDDESGRISFKVESSAPRATGGGRIVTATFIARSPGVSPVSVGLQDTNDGNSADPDMEGKGIVRVR